MIAYLNKTYDGTKKKTATNAFKHIAENTS